MEFYDPWSPVLGKIVRLRHQMVGSLLHLRSLQESIVVRRKNIDPWQLEQPKVESGRSEILIGNFRNNQPIEIGPSKLGFILARYLQKALRETALRRGCTGEPFRHRCGQFCPGGKSTGDSGKRFRIHAET